MGAAALLGRLAAAKPADITQCASGRGSATGSVGSPRDKERAAGRQAGRRQGTRCAHCVRFLRSYGNAMSIAI